MKRCTLTLVFVITMSMMSTLIAQYQLQNAFPSLSFSSPVDLQHAGDGTDRIFVVEQAGRIKVFPNLPNQSTTKMFLDITDRVSSGGEMGLLGLAFHPNYANNGYFYVNYTTSNPRTTRISRFSVTSNPDSADKNSELILLSFSQPYSNHNGGQIAFDPDGYLLIAVGDGGSGCDPLNAGQSLNTLLGKMLRIDVNAPSGGLNYSIPPDNPFAGNSQGYREEIFAYGLRNPWRFSIDPETHWNWCADVGQTAREEINIIESGKNYGWKVMEGFLCNTCQTGCDTTGMTLPIFDYPRTAGKSVTGGFVYRGPNQPGLYGKYIYADYVDRHIWSLEYDGTNPPVNTFLLTMSGSPSTFGVDLNNELYVVAHGGTIFKFIPTAQIIAPSNLQVSFGGAGDIYLTWNDNSNNESGFKIERKIDNGNFELIDSVGANVTSFTNFITEPGNYTYRVYAYNATHTSGFSNQASVYVSVVPVEMTVLTAQVDDYKVLLSWETLSENNNLGFDIERSINNNWAKIGFVEGAGTSSLRHSYQFTDVFEPFQFNGTILYRLKQIDLNGSFTYSSEVRVDIDFKHMDYNLEQNYPNPFNPETVIRFNLPEESNVKIKVINILGKTVEVLTNDVKSAGSYSLVWNASEFASGIYYFQMEAQSLVSDRVFIKAMKMVYLK